MTALAPMVILDADGVFLSERHYWDAALGVALRSADLLDAIGDRAASLGDVAFGDVGLQRVCKARGCNSNWDLAAVLVRALERGRLRSTLHRAFRDGNDREAMDRLAEAAAASWRPERGELAVDDPLSGFGIRRDGVFYARIGLACQAELATGGAVAAEDVDEIVRVFRELERRGCVLRVCTGRPRDEIEPPLRELGLDGFLPAAALTCADEVERAGRARGGAHLGKPHWFPAACAALGFDAACVALAGGALMAPPRPTVYVGDAWADFSSVERSRRRGLDLTYVHKRSGVTTPSQERTIAASGFALGVVDRLRQLPGLLPGAAA